jgi:hypothetical protein
MSIDGQIPGYCARAYVYLLTVAVKCIHFHIASIILRVSLAHLDMGERERATCNTLTCTRPTLNLRIIMAWIDPRNNPLK